MKIPLFAALAAVMTSHAAESPYLTRQDGVFRLFENAPADASVVQGGSHEVQINAVKRAGRVMQIRVYALPADKKPVTVKIADPFAGASVNWTMPVTREGDVFVARIPWNGMLIGDRMDVNEGAEGALRLHEKMKSQTAGSHLPVVYNSGDSISLGNWPYLEADIADAADLYSQYELSNDDRSVKLTNNGRAELAYGVLETAYRRDSFRPKVILVNFGLHMISGYKKNIPGYAAWIVRFDELAKKHGARFVWINTTPYDPAYPAGDNKTVSAFNAAALRVAEERGIPLIDLHGFVSDLVKKRTAAGVYTDGVHYKPEVCREMGAFIAEKLRPLVPKESVSVRQAPIPKS